MTDINYFDLAPERRNQYEYTRKMPEIPRTIRRR